RGAATLVAAVAVAVAIGIATATARGARARAASGRPPAPTFGQARRAASRGRENPTAARPRRRPPARVGNEPEKNRDADGPPSYRECSFRKSPSNAWPIE